MNSSPRWPPPPDPPRRARRQRRRPPLDGQRRPRHPPPRPDPHSRPGLPRPDGRPAVDYTVDAEVGIPQITGSEEGAAPVNHVLPAWDLVAALTVSTAVLTALYERAATGSVVYAELALSDVALAGVANMGAVTGARA